jgi:hypothetical protein
MAIYYFDRYIDKRRGCIPECTLSPQSIARFCLFLAFKCDDNGEDTPYVSACTIFDSLISHQEIWRVESLILTALNHSLYHQTPIHWVLLYMDRIIRNIYMKIKPVTPTLVALDEEVKTADTVRLPSTPTPPPSPEAPRRTVSVVATCIYDTAVAIACTLTSASVAPSPTYTSPPTDELPFKKPPPFKHAIDLLPLILHHSFFSNVLGSIDAFLQTPHGTHFYPSHIAASALHFHLPSTHKDDMIRLSRYTSASILTPRMIFHHAHHVASTPSGIHIQPLYCSHGVHN